MLRHVPALDRKRIWIWLPQLGSALLMACQAVMEAPSALAETAGSIPSHVRPVSVVTGVQLAWAAVAAASATPATPVMIAVAPMARTSRRLPLRPVPCASRPLAGRASHLFPLSRLSSPAEHLPTASDLRVQD